MPQQNLFKTTSPRHLIAILNWKSSNSEYAILYIMHLSHHQWYTWYRRQIRHGGQYLLAQLWTRLAIHSHVKLANRLVHAGSIDSRCVTRSFRAQSRRSGSCALLGLCPEHIHLLLSLFHRWKYHWTIPHPVALPNRVLFCRDEINL